MKKVTFLLSLSLLFLYGCSEESLITENSGENYTQEILRGPGGGNGNGNGIIHHASLGGNDACEAFGLPPGCDKNFSLVANMHADGSVSGQWQDGFAGDDGIHVSIDCMQFLGNAAIVGGYITHGTNGGVDVTGLYAVTAVWDNGTSNNDPDDQISFSYMGVAPDFCGYDIINFARNDLTRGQVKVW